jgi:hypothetical protein
VPTKIMFRRKRMSLIKLVSKTYLLATKIVILSLIISGKFYRPFKYLNDERNKSLESLNSLRKTK